MATGNLTLKNNETIVHWQAQFEGRMAAYAYSDNPDERRFGKKLYALARETHGLLRDGNITIEYANRVMSAALRGE